MPQLWKVSVRITPTLPPTSSQDSLLARGKASPIIGSHAVKKDEWFWWGKQKIFGTGCVWKCCFSQKSAYLMKDCGMWMSEWCLPSSCVPTPMERSYSVLNVPDTHCSTGNSPSYHKWCWHTGFLPSYSDGFITGFRSHHLPNSKSHPLPFSPSRVST